MRGFIAGFVIGVILVTGAGVYANPDLIGRKIEGTFPFFIKSERAPLDVIVVNGTSYAPVRAMCELLKYRVWFDESKRQVHVDAPPTTPDSISEIKYMVATNIDGIGNNYEVFTIEQDGELFVELTPFGKYFSWKKPVATITIPSTSSVDITIADGYEPGVSGFVYEGRCYLAAKALPVTVEIRNNQTFGNYLWIGFIK